MQNSPNTCKEVEVKTPKQDVVQKKVESIEAKVKRNISIQYGRQEDEEEIGAVSGVT